MRNLEAPDRSRHHDPWTILPAHHHAPRPLGEITRARFFLRQLREQRLVQSAARQAMRGAAPPDVPGRSEAVLHTGCPSHLLTRPRNKNAGPQARDFFVLLKSGCRCNQSVQINHALLGCASLKRCIAWLPTTYADVTGPDSATFAMAVTAAHRSEFGASTPQYLSDGSGQLRPLPCDGRRTKGRRHGLCRRRQKDSLAHTINPK